MSKTGRSYVFGIHGYMKLILMGSRMSYRLRAVAEVAEVVAAAVAEVEEVEAVEAVEEVETKRKRFDG
jgi:hypothetical protein